MTSPSRLVMTKPYWLSIALDEAKKGRKPPARSTHTWATPPSAPCAEIKPPSQSSTLVAPGVGCWSTIWSEPKAGPPSGSRAQAKAPPLSTPSIHSSSCGWPGVSESIRNGLVWSAVPYTTASSNPLVVSRAPNGKSALSPSNSATASPPSRRRPGSNSMSAPPTCGLANRKNPALSVWNPSRSKAA